jgi:hypothetical protein
MATASESVTMISIAVEALHATAAVSVPIVYIPVEALNGKSCTSYNGLYPCRGPKWQQLQFQLQ